jgi:hypothetical protein
VLLKAPHHEEFGFGSWGFGSCEALMISSIYNQTPPKWVKRKRETVLYFKRPAGGRGESKYDPPVQETLTTITKWEKKGTRTKRKKMVHKPKTVKVRKEIRQIARTFYPSWTECVKQYRRDTYVPSMANALKSDTQPLNQGSLEARICGWIEQNIESYVTSKKLQTVTVEDYQTKWHYVLSLIREGHHFMNKGYGSVPPPTLAWLFSYGKAGEWNINRVVNQEFDWIATFKSDDSTMR